MLVELSAQKLEVSLARPAVSKACSNSGVINLIFATESAIARTISHSANVASRGGYIAVITLIKCSIVKMARRG